MPAKPPAILVINENVLKHSQFLQEYQLIPAFSPEQKTKAIQLHSQDIRAVITTGTAGFSAQDIDSLPFLEIICAIGAGFENIDLAAVSSRGIIVTNGAGVNASTVADHAFALILSNLRGVVESDAAFRQGQWHKPTAHTVYGKKLGVLGLGAIGKEVAKRAEGGFGMTIHYYSRTKQPDSKFTYHSNPIDLAKASDILVVTTPGGAETKGLVNKDVLKALGSSGYLINVARGSVVDTKALVEALNSGIIAGAGLDVFENEPNIPQDLVKCPNTVFTAHIGARAPETSEAMIRKVAENLHEHFAGRPVKTPVKIPEKKD